MILFAADDHYGAHPGKCIYEKVRQSYNIDFFENDWSCFTKYDLENECELIILNMIADTCGVTPPDADAESRLKAYCEIGGSFLLLHGSSAAFWHWEWWRTLQGFRWVRGNDPDNVSASSHPARPYRVNVAKCRHPLCRSLRQIDLPEDEIYIRLEQTSPAMVLMETDTDEGTFPQCYETITPWGGKIIGFIPGHRREVTENENFIANIKILIDYLLERGLGK